MKWEYIVSYSHVGGKGEAKIYKKKVLGFWRG